VMKTLNEKPVGRRKRLLHLDETTWGRRFRLPTLRARTGVLKGALPRNLSERSLAAAVR
jgi:hypothetical protein